jgi:transposase
MITGGSVMPKKYNQDFKDMLIELHAAGKGPAELSKDYDVPVATLGKWFTENKQTAAKDYSTADVAAMRAEYLQMKQENEILKKALGIFAKPTK